MQSLMVNVKKESWSRLLENEKAMPNLGEVGGKNKVMTVIKMVRVVK